MQGEWDSTWDVEALRGARLNIEGARKIKVQKLRADQEQERRDMEARHKRAVEEVRTALDLPYNSLVLLWACSWLAAALALGMPLAGSWQGLPGLQLSSNIWRQFMTKGP